MLADNPLTQFPDFNAAREAIQSNASCMADIAGFLKEHGWFIVAAQLRAKASMWSLSRQQQFFKDNRDFKLNAVDMPHAGRALHARDYYWESSMRYQYQMKESSDRIDVEYALEALGLISAGVGSQNGSDGHIRGHRNIRVQAQAWHFVAEPCITETLGDSCWDSERSGANRWYKHAELDAIASVKDALGLTYDDVIELAKTRFLDTQNRSGHLCGPLEFSL